MHTVNMCIMYIAIAQHATTTRVPSFFCPGSRTTSEAVVRRASGLYYIFSNNCSKSDDNP